VSKGQEIKEISREEGRTEEVILQEAVRHYLIKKNWEKIRSYGAEKAKSRDKR
jgi:citrate lyase synthetase